MNGGSDQVSNKQLYDALMDIQGAIADIRVLQAALPCREHAHALDGHDTRLAELRAEYRRADCGIKAEMRRRQIIWTGGGIGATLAVIAGWLGWKG